MPHGIHKTPAKTFRPDPELYVKGMKAVSAVDSNMNAHLNAFLRWLTHETDELPKRPPASLFADS